MISAEASLSLGIDAVEIERFRTVLARRPGLATRLFTSEERINADGAPRSVESLAARFCAKEATMKVLGCGVGGVGFRSIVLTTSAAGAPEIHLTGKAKALAQAQGFGVLSCSLTHTKSMAMAVVGSVRS